MGNPAALLTPDELGDALTGILTPGATGLVLAVSGGPDSMALMHVAASLHRMGRLPPLSIATVNHGLRETADADAQVVADRAAALVLPCHILRWNGEKPASRLQERAREARYALLTAHCRMVGADHLATAHTQDDQAETVLFRLLRGSGPAGLAGMRPVTALGRIQLLRPLLAVPKARLVATCEAAGILVCQDPANTNPRFARTRLRALLPALSAEGGDARVFGRFAARMARADAALTEGADHVYHAATLASPAATLRLDGKRIAQAPDEIMIRVFGMAIAGAGGRAVRLDRLEKMTMLFRSSTRAGRAFQATLGGTMLHLDRDGVVTIAPEMPRRTHAANHAAAPPPSFPWQA